MQKKQNEILTRAVSTVVFTNSVIFLFVFLLILHLLLKTLKIGVSAKNKRNKAQKKQKT